MGFQRKFLESGQPGDYETDIDALASEGYNVIITVGPLMGDASATKAKQYPDIKSAIVDNAYSEGGLTNVTSLMFAEDQAGFLAGYLAAGVTTTASRSWPLITRRSCYATARSSPRAGMISR